MQDEGSHYMQKRYSIAQARDHLSEVTQAEFQRLRSARLGLWEATVASRETVDLSDIRPDDVYGDVRDRSPGRPVS